MSQKKAVKKEHGHTHGPANSQQKPVKRFSEDWQALLIAGGVILLAVLGVLGKNGINITF